MAGLKNADDYKDGERFKGAGILGFGSLMVGVGAIVVFFVIVLLGREFTLDLGDGKGRTLQLSDNMAFSWLFAVVFFLSLSSP